MLNLIFKLNRHLQVTFGFFISLGVVLPNTGFGQEEPVRWIEDIEELTNLFSDKTFIGGYVGSDQPWLEYYSQDGELIYTDDYLCYQPGFWKIIPNPIQACFGYYDSQTTEGFRLSCFSIARNNQGQVLFTSTSESRQTIAYSIEIQPGNIQNLPIATGRKDQFCQKPVASLR